MEARTVASGLEPWKQICIGDRVEVVLESALQLLRKTGIVINRFEYTGRATVIVQLDDGSSAAKFEDEVKYLP